MILALPLALCLGAAPIPVAGCPAALEAVHGGSASTSSRELATQISAPLASDLDRLPTLKAALDALARAHGDEVAPARRDLKTTLAAICAPALPYQAAGAVNRSRLADILDEPDFRRSRVEGPALGTILERLWDLIKESMYTQGFSSFSNVSRALFLVLVALGSAWLASQLRQRRPARPSAPPGHTQRRPATGPTPEELARMAAAALERGDLSESLKLEMSALRGSTALLLGDGQADCRTDWEWAAQVHCQLHLDLEAGALQQLVRNFERSYYGGIPPNPAEATEFHRLGEVLRSRVERGATT